MKAGKVSQSVIDLPGLKQFNPVCAMTDTRIRQNDFLHSVLAAPWKQIIPLNWMLAAVNLE